VQAPHCLWLAPAVGSADSCVGIFLRIKKKKKLQFLYFIVSVLYCLGSRVFFYAFPPYFLYFSPPFFFFKKQK
jgi:hypothetical protein